MEHTADGSTGTLLAALRHADWDLSVDGHPELGRHVDAETRQVVPLR